MDKARLDGRMEKSEVRKLHLPRPYLNQLYIVTGVIRYPR